jgi:hypothetical protein
MIVLHTCPPRPPLVAGFFIRGKTALTFKKTPVALTYDATGALVPAIQEKPEFGHTRIADH